MIWRSPAGATTLVFQGISWEVPPKTVLVHQKCGRTNLRRSFPPCSSEALLERAVEKDGAKRPPRTARRHPWSHWEMTGDAPSMLRKRNVRRGGQSSPSLGAALRHRGAMVDHPFPGRLRKTSPTPERASMVANEPLGRLAQPRPEPSRRFHLIRHAD
jgi:hypothetical protein